MSKWDDVVSNLQAASDAMVGLAEEGTRSETLPKHISKALGLAIKCRKTANSRDSKAAERVAKLTDRAARVQQLLEEAKARIERALGNGSVPNTSTENQTTEAPSTDQPQDQPADVAPITENVQEPPQGQPKRRKRELSSA